jgi:hypothetical protein
MFVGVVGVVPIKCFVKSASSSTVPSVLLASQQNLEEKLKLLSVRKPSGLMLEILPGNMRIS